MKNYLLAMASAVLVGCASVTISGPGSMSGIELKDAHTPADRVVVIRNSGMYFLWKYVVGSGDLSWNDKKNDINGGIAFFKDYSNARQIYMTLNRIAERENCDLADVTLNESADTSGSLMSYQGAAACIFGMNEVAASAVLCPRKGDGK